MSKCCKKLLDMEDGLCQRLLLQGGLHAGQQANRLETVSLLA